MNRVGLKPRLRPPMVCEESCGRDEDSDSWKLVSAPLEQYELSDMGRGPYVFYKE